MDPDDMRQIAAEAQFVARLLAPYQNLGTIRLPGSALNRFFRWLFRRTGPTELTTRDVVRLTCALLNAGNALEMVCRAAGGEPQPCCKETK